MELYFILTIIAYFLFSSDLNTVTFIPLIGSFIYAFQRLLPLMQQVYSAWANYKFKYTAINDVLVDLDKNKDNEVNYLSRNNLKFRRNIILKNVDFGYEKSNLVLKNINLKINKGDLIGIYGKTGIGKSTLLDLIMGLLDPIKGEVIIDNLKVDKKQFNHNWISNIGHVPQTIFLKDGTIAENIAFGEKLENINFDLLLRVSKIADIYDFIKNMDKGFYSLVGERGILLSGGQRQRIAIARALYQSRSILVLDEATSALDEITERILNSILNMNKQLTIILVTHRIKTLTNCNRVIRIINKEIFEEK